MDYLLREFFPDGDVPVQLQPYQDFVKRIRSVDHYHDVLEAKLQRDSEYLSRRDRSLDEMEDPVYQRLVINVVDADKIKPVSLEKMFEKYSTGELNALIK